MENTVNLSVQEQAVADIKRWLGLRTKKQLKLVEKFFEGKRNYFTIDKSDYEQWATNNPTQLHAYVTVTKNNKLQFALIDSVTDEKIAQGEAGDFDDFIRIKAFEKQPKEKEMLGVTPGNPIPADEALERMNRWDNDQDRDNYLTDELDRTPNEDPNEGIFTVFKIPFGDLEAIFGDEQAPSSKAYSYMGLQEYKSPCGNAPTDADPAWMADMLLWNEQENPTARATQQDDTLVGDPEDAVAICPPLCDGNYTTEGYGLMTDALNA